MFFQPRAAAAHSSRSCNAPPSLGRTATVRRSLLLVPLAFALAACDLGSPLQANHHASHEGGLMLSSLTRAANAPALDALTQLTAPFHDVDAAQAAGYNLLLHRR